MTQATLIERERSRDNGAASSWRTVLSRYRWVLWRVVLAVVTLGIASLLIFWVTLALPSDAARIILGPEASPEGLEQFRQEFGLDQPFINQYWQWLTNVVRGDFGHSIAARQPVAALLGTQAFNTATLLVVTLAVAVPVALLLGGLAALKRDRLVDRVFQGMSLVLIAVPDFIVGMVLILVFATGVFQILPAVTLISPTETTLQHPLTLILPGATVGLAIIPYLGLTTRAAMIDVLGSDYIAMARLKGVPERQVIFRHALLNVLAPVLQGLALVIAWLAGGIVVVEFVFNYPGVGGALVHAVGARDVPMIQAVVLLLATVVVTANLIADVMTVLVTPRLRTEGKR